METVTKKVNRIYSKENPSTYLKNLNQLDKFINNRVNLLLDLKLPKKIFKNSSLIDFGSGAGLNTIVYSFLGAKCTLVEYDKKSIEYSKKLFKKFSKNKFKIINKDIFGLKINKKYDFVISNGVAHHTKNPLLNLKICVKALKKNGFFILGIGETNGFFQRNLQRYILYSLSNNEREMIILAKSLFKKHLIRSKKFSGRTVNEIIYDTYLNPKINTLSLIEILKFFKKNNLEVYSFYGKIKSLEGFLENNPNQFKLKNPSSKKKSLVSSLNTNLHDIENFSLTTNKVNKSHHDLYNKFNQLNDSLNKLTESINDISFDMKNKRINHKEINPIIKKVKNLSKIDIIDKDYNLKFLSELRPLFKILNSKTKKENKIIKIKKYLSICNALLKGVNGTGMNYVVGYKK